MIRLRRKNQSKSTTSKKMRKPRFSVLSSSEVMTFVETSLMEAGAEFDRFRLGEATDLQEARLHIESALTGMTELEHRS